MRAVLARLTAFTVGTFVAAAAAAHDGSHGPASSGTDRAAPVAQAAGAAKPAAPAARAGGAPVTVELKPVRLGPHSWVVLGDLGMISHENQGFNSNAGFVITDDGVVVFDALGTPPLGAALLREIRKLTDKPVRIVVVSHYHSDHMYGLQAFKEAGAQIWAHRLAREYLATDAPDERLKERRQSLAPWVDERTRVLPADRWLDGETSFELGGVAFRVIPVGPAHTPEDLMLYVENDGVLYAGDLMFGSRIPFVGNADPKNWLQALERLIERKPRVLVGGHGEVSRNASRDLAATREYLHFLREQMGRAVEQMMNFEEAYRSTDWSRFRDAPAFEDANRRNAYNTFIRMERESLGESGSK